MGTWCWGEKDPNPHGQTAPYLIQAYQELTTYVSLTLLAQTELKPYYDAITLSWNAPTNNIEFNIQPIVSLLKTKYETNSAEAIEDISNLYKSLKMSTKLTFVVKNVLRNCLKESIQVFQRI